MKLAKPCHLLIDFNSKLTVNIMAMLAIDIAVFTELTIIMVMVVVHYLMTSTFCIENINY